MQIQIYRREDQADGNFNGGAIREKKPIGFPQDGGILRPYSNLFYWSHAWSEKGSTIGEHPHQGFEIMSFILTGKIEHYDSKLGDWKTLHAGGAQIIRSGSGITHAEHLHAGSSIFQIWVDPDITRTIQTEASYEDFPSGAFPVENREGTMKKIFTQGGHPIKMISEGLYIYQLSMQSDVTFVDPGPENIFSAFLLEGQVEVEGKTAGRGDFLVIRDPGKIRLVQHSGHPVLFVVESPARPPYTTYAEKFMS